VLLEQQLACVQLLVADGLVDAVKPRWLLPQLLVGGTQGICRLHEATLQMQADGRGMEGCLCLWVQSSHGTADGFNPAARKKQQQHHGSHTLPLVALMCSAKHTSTVSHSPEAPAISVYV